VVVAAALTLAAQVEIWAPSAALGTSGVEGSRPVLSLTSLIATAPLCIRRSLPLLACALVMGGAAAQALLSTPSDGLTMLIVLGLSTYSVAAHAPHRSAVIGAGLALISVAAIAKDAGDAAFLVLVVGAPWVVGRLMRRRSADVDLLGARTEQLERQQAETAHAAAERERSRIARELHDIVAHRVSTIVVQAQVADTLLEKDIDGARAAVNAIDDAGRQALAELRSLLGLMRSSEAENDLSPQPDLERVPILVDETRRAGVPVMLHLEGTPYPVPAAVGVTAYRIVQEALTNVVKHAGSARTDVTIRYGRSAIDIVVDDQGDVAEERADPGYGLLGMRERAAHVGGTIEAGPHLGGGFSVRAILPVEVISQ
jgi:signal transduction histidine kinase